jgi:hypothetical protein
MDDDKPRESRTDIPSGHMPDEFDRLMGSLDGLPDVTRTRPSSMTAMPLMGVGGSTTFIVQTLQKSDVVQKETDVRRSRFITFLQIAGPTGFFRHVLPTEVTDTILRQRDALTAKTRSKTARALAADRKAAGWVPDTSGLERARGKARKPRRRKRAKR